MANNHTLNSHLVEELESHKSPIYISNPTNFADKIDKIVSAGLMNLMAIVDFDFTLSRFTLNGEKCWTTHSVLEDAMKGHDVYYQKSLELKAKYTPIEYCPIMSIEEKIPYMIEWWDGSHELTVKSQFRESELEKYCAGANVHLRDGANELVRLLDENSVPVLVFSAGVQDIIERFLRREMSSIPSSVHVISNKMEFSEEGICTGFRRPLIHTFNKNSSVISKGEPFFDKITHRTSNNVLLLGDSLGDTHMDIGLEKEGVVLRIGFLNFNVEQLLNKYLEAYDLVIIDGESMEIPLFLLKHILSRMGLADRGNV